ncbi:MAG: hypothetical protein HY812_20600 [Planctomycetes bacterium]|nr:hypothetical protein [Planctomycetota bacterium]
MARRLRSLYALSFASLLALALASSASAQLDDWSSVVTWSPTVKIEQSVQYAIDGSTVHAFSGYSRGWTSLNCTLGGPTCTLSNEHLIVQDGPTYYGFASRSGQFSALTPAGGGTLLTNGSPQSWFNVVVDGNDVHFFSGITGQWYSSSYSSAPSVLTTGRLCVLVSDGTNVWGISAYHGDAVPLSVSGAVPMDALGNMCLATSAGQVHGFSAHRDTWASLSVTGSPAVSSGFANQPGCVAIEDNTSISFFSGQTGTFTTLPAALTSTLSLHRMCAVVVDGTTAYAYSGLLGAYQTMSFATVPAVSISHFFAILSEGGAARAYSAESNSFAAPLSGAFDFQMSQTAALATPTGSNTPSDAYSCLNDQWTAAPPVPGAEVYLAANAIVLVGPAGFLYGFSPRYASWATLLVPYPNAVYQGNSAQGKGLLTARVGNDLHTFNPRSGQWRSVTVAASVVSAKPHWNASIFHDGVNAYAFGAYNDRWSTIPLQSGAATLSAQIYSGNVDETNLVTAYTAYGQFMLSADYPDYWRAIGLGGRLNLTLGGEPGSPSLLVLGLTPASIPTSYGTLLIDPATMVLVSLPPLNGAGLLDLGFTVPVNPILAGLEIYFQGAIFGPGGLYLTNAESAKIM